MMKKISVILIMLSIFICACNQKKVSTNIESLGKLESAFLDSRNVDVWLPPDYSDNEESYPVIYMHDGQNLFFP